MTPLRQRMLEDMQLRGLSARTQECYVAAVRQLAAHYHTSPASLTDDQLRQCFLYLTNEKKVARTTATIALCAMRFLYEQTLHQPWPTLRFVRPAPSTRLPTVLSRDEVRQVLGLVRIRVYRECLTTIYAGGLRLLEGARIQIADIDSGRMLFHIHGKGSRDRYVPLPTPLLPRLRDYWSTHRSREWLFPAPTRRGLPHSLAHHGGPVTRSSLQSAFRRAWRKSGIAKRASVHTLRHSYGTHLHEAGVSLRVIQEILGHRSVRTTQIYTHLTSDAGAISSPQQNGRHERMHRTLKAEATRPPSANLRAQQIRFNRFRHEYNDERPHEALDQETPGSVYQPSPRALPRTLAPLEYPGHFEVRLVSRNSGIRWKKRWVCVTHTLAGEYVGLEEVDEGLWDVYFGPVKLGRMNERLLRIEDHKGRTVRRGPAGTTTEPADAM